jgi:hypothetical protein
LAINESLNISYLRTGKKSKMPSFRVFWKGRSKREAGWRWSKHVKPVAKTEWCEAPHFQYHVSGRLHIVMSDGKEYETGPGDGTFLPAGHDAWVVGNELVVLVDWYGATNYAKE